MDNPRTLAARLDRLERANRRWRFAAIGLGLFALVGADASPVVPEVRTRKLLLVDDKDRPAAVLRCVPGQPSGLMFVDPDHPDKVVSVFGWGADGSGLLEVNTKDGRNVDLNTGAVNDKGVPLENVRKALEKMQHSTLP